MFHISLFTLMCGTIHGVNAFDIMNGDEWFLCISRAAFVLIAVFLGFDMFLQLPSEYELHILAMIHWHLLNSTFVTVCYGFSRCLTMFALSCASRITCSSYIPHTFPVCNEPAPPPRWATRVFLWGTRVVMPVTRCQAVPGGRCTESLTLAVSGGWQERKSENRRWQANEGHPCISYGRP